MKGKTVVARPPSVGPAVPAIHSEEHVFSGHLTCHFTDPLRPWPMKLSPPNSLRSRPSAPP